MLRNTIVCIRIKDYIRLLAFTNPTTLNNTIHKIKSSFFQSCLPTQNTPFPPKEDIEDKEQKTRRALAHEKFICKYKTGRRENPVYPWPLQTPAQLNLNEKQRGCVD